jgi:acetolactate synthase-1/2/3 large subunit
LGRYGRNVASTICAEADLVIAIGTTLGAMTTDNFTTPRQGTKIVHIAIDEMSLGCTYEESLSINADPVSALEALSDTAAQDKLDGKGWADWTNKVQQQVQEWRDKFAELASQTMDDGRINPIHLISELNQHIGGDDVVVSDTGSQTRWSGCMIDAKTPGRNFLRAAGSLGWSFPGAIGAKLAVGKGRRVFNLTGDGGIGYHATEMETAVRMDIPLISVVMNNAQFQGYSGLLSRGLGYQAECPELSNFSDVDFGGVAKAFGAYGERVEDPAEIRPALKRAEESGQPAMIDIAISGNIGAPHGAAGAL